MPVLDNPRHERFAKNLAAGMAPSVAYLDAGYGTTSAASTASAAAQLCADPDIDARVKELLGRAAERAVITRARIHQMLLEDRQDARTKNQFSVAVRAAELLGKDIGMFVDKKEIKTSKLEELSIEELNAIVDQLTEPGPASGAESEGSVDHPGTEDRSVLPEDRPATPGALPKAA